LIYAHKHSVTVTTLSLVRQFLKRNTFTQFHETSTVESLTLAHGRTDGPVSTSHKALFLFCSVKKGSTPSIFLPCPFNIWPLQQQQPVPNVTPSAICTGTSGHCSSSSPCLTSRRLPSAQAHLATAAAVRA
jgi:hypothetical protein